MQDLFYVIYAPDVKLFMNDEGGFGAYEGAARFTNILDANCLLVDGLRIVGPCIEGDAP